MPPASAELLTKKLVELRAMPEEIDWHDLLTWLTAIRPLLRRWHPDHLADVDQLIVEPRWPMVPRFSSGGRTHPISGRRTPSQNNFAEAASVERSSRLKIVADRRARAEALLATLLAMAQADPTRSDDEEALSRMLERFGTFAHQLGRRQRSRPPFVFKDEYDVQDSLHALLRAFFDDVRPEEWTPSYAGGSSRIDFLIPEIAGAVEVKMVRPNLTPRELGEQLIVDIERYASHQGCRSLWCLVFDPQRRIVNPRGIERDLERIRSEPDDSGLAVRVFIRS